VQEGGFLSHNIFVQAGAELGVTGLILFSSLILASLLLTRKVRLRATRRLETRHYEHLANGLDGALLGFVVSGFFVTVLYYPYFWVNLSFTVALYNVVRSNPEMKRGRAFARFSTTALSHGTQRAVH